MPSIAGGHRASEQQQARRRAGILDSVRPTHEGDTATRGVLVVVETRHYAAYRGVEPA
jgi:hypothetical protein